MTDLLQVATRSGLEPGSFTGVGPFFLKVRSHAATLRPLIPGVIINSEVAMRPVTQGRG